MAHFNVQFCKVSMARWLQRFRKGLSPKTGELGGWVAACRAPAASFLLCPSAQLPRGLGCAPGCELGALLG